MEQDEQATEWRLISDIVYLEITEYLFAQAQRRIVCNMHAACLMPDRVATISQLNEPRSTKC